MDRKTILDAGWKPPHELPELDEEGYEKWRPALCAWLLFTGNNATPSEPLDYIDKGKIDGLREAFAVAPRDQ